MSQKIHQFTSCSYHVLFYLPVHTHIFRIHNSFRKYLYFCSLDLKLDFIFAVGKEVEIGSHSLFHAGLNFITYHRLALDHSSPLPQLPEYTVYHTIPLLACYFYDNIVVPFVVLRVRPRTFLLLGKGSRIELYFLPIMPFLNISVIDLLQLLAYLVGFCCCCLTSQHPNI